MAMDTGTDMDRERRRDPEDAMIQIDQVEDARVAQQTRTLRSLAVHSLARMYCPDERLFAFRLRRHGDADVLEGRSRRYTATALIGLASEDRSVVREVLGHQSLEDVCTTLIEHLNQTKDLGEVALTTWAARMLDHPRAGEAVRVLRQMEPGQRAYCTVELAWTVTALVIDGSDATDMAQADVAAEALLAAFREDSCLFRRWPAGCVVPKLPSFVNGIGDRLPAVRTHVSCFADFVYPVQALSHYHRVTGNARAAEVARRCAERMCNLQGPQGQWWWHYDIRTGEVIERYPVYSVHQDAMGPMALFAVARACGRDYTDAIDRGVHWLFHPSENIPSLVDVERDIIWRKVARRGPGKLVRGLQAMASGLHPSLRVPGVDALFPPVTVDYESRPYHMGWILHAWPTDGAL